MSEIPEHWATAMRGKGFTWRDAPSISRLAAASGLSVETVRRMVHGIGEPSAEAILKVSNALGADVADWLGRKSAGDLYVGPDASRHLTGRQRRALHELINALLDVEAGETGATGSDTRKKSVDPYVLEAQRTISTQSVIDAGWQRAARRRTTPPTATPDLDAQAQAGEENQDLA